MRRVEAYSDAKLKIVTIGCSHALGIGIDDSSTWAEQLKKLISARFKTDNVEVFNLGTPGASSDLNTVQLYQLIDIIQPNIVMRMPPAWRRYDIGSEWLDLLSQDSFFKLHKNEIEHGVHNIQRYTTIYSVYSLSLIHISEPTRRRGI